ncbi:hypothetical protein PR202_ga18832 [Eleusine coracana subsp. coracana]|uniref:NEDD8 ultimate buster 1 n=1 Tax=Eleusine coracana subsp. coracana TaxID=191504 RepID=A0AAV5CUI5_ELECO|nr:hypothetical protein PR202_ga18832 [Eleusine coracana subsp. coracana]
MASGEASAPAADRIRVVGAWAGALELDLDGWTVPMLRAEIARRAGEVEPDRVGLIFGGRVLKDESPGSLRQAGLKGNAKVLTTLASPDRAKEIAAEASKAKADEEHANKLVRLWDAAKALSQRHSDGSYLDGEDYNLDLEDQSGQKVMFGSVEDMKALKMALMLNQKGKTLMTKKMYKEALDVLVMAEEAFSLCDAKLIEKVDNVPMLQLDIVCYVRLELLEGVVAYHNGHSEKARGSLTSAQAKYLQLQVPDEAISMLTEMGYDKRSAKRALKMTGYDIQSSVDLLCEERDKKIRRREEDLRTQREIEEQKTYGRTAMNKAVDMQKLKDLTAIGFEKYLAAEALRINENDAEKALDLLTNPEENSILQNHIEARRRRRRQDRGPSSSRARELAARFSQTINDARASLNRRAAHAAEGNPAPLAAEGNPAPDAAEGNLPAGNDANPPDENDGNQPDENDANPPDENNAVEGIPPEGINEVLLNNAEAMLEGVEEDEAMAEADVDDEVANAPPVAARDATTEDELANGLTGNALDDYDIEVSAEGQAIAEYLSLLESAATS